MNALAIVVAAVALVPQPKSLVETGGVTTNMTVVYSIDTAIPAEGYRLEISPDGVSIASSDAAGAFYAERTLAQFGGGALPCCRIEDAPTYRWRGYLIDEGRHFFGKGEMKRLIDVMADYKYNVFHWHLTEDQGWRLAMDKWPRLAEIGSVRRSSPPPGEEKGYDNEQYGPYFYTKDEIREIVAYARERHVEIVPEIDFPGHVLSALAAYPELSCTGGPFETGTQWGVSEDILCAGNDRTMEFLRDVMDEVCEMFPSKVIHLGGDEAPRVRWNKCAKCMARVKALGLKDTNALQGWMFREIQGHLKAKGRRAMGWEVKYGDAELGLGVDAALGDTTLPKDALVHSWRSVEAGVGLVTNGYDVVMSSYMDTYYTLPIGLGELDPFPYRQWTKGKKLDLETSYMFSPMASVPEAYRKNVLGGEACAWTESTHNRAELEWKMFPRALAHAETLWTDPPRRDFADFARRAEVHRLRLLARGINCSPLGTQTASPASPSVASFCEGAERGERLTVAFLGGSLSWGANATDPNRTSWRAKVGEKLERRYPDAHFKFVDAAIGGTDSQLGIFRLERDVIAYKPDIVFVEWLVNDGTRNAGDNLSCSYEGIIRHLMERLPDCVPVQVFLPVRETIEEQDAAKLLRWDEQRRTGAAYGLVCADVLGEMRKRCADGTADLGRMWPALIGDNTHPHDFGYGLYADIVWDEVFADPSPLSPTLAKEWLFAPKYRHVVRENAAEWKDIPKGWHRDFCSMRAGTFDFLCSRWQDGLAVAANCAFNPKTRKRELVPDAVVEPLRATFRGEVLMLYGESAVQSSKCEVYVDGVRVAQRDTADFGRRFDPSAYLVWQVGSGFDADREHTLEIRPIFDDGEPQEFRLGSICVAGRNAAWVRQSSRVRSATGSE